MPDTDMARSMEEEGLYDYVIVNDELDKAFEELSLIAERALAGEIGAAPEHLQVPPSRQSCSVVENETSSNAGATSDVTFQQTYM